MGGRIWVESEEGLGSTFHFTAWVQPSQAKSADEAAAGGSPALIDTATDPVRRLRILVADDVRVNQKLLQRMLEKFGHQVTVVTNGREAADIVSTETFDLVFMDVQMPVMDGLEATLEIRRREELQGSRLPIVAVTAHAMQGDKERFLAAGMDGYISKPIAQAEVAGAIAAALNR
jgi:CheY-like chemotaxis protein